MSEVVPRMPRAAALIEPDEEDHSPRSSKKQCCQHIHAEESSPLTDMVNALLALKGEGGTPCPKAAACKPLYHPATYSRFPSKKRRADVDKSDLAAISDDEDHGCSKKTEQHKKDLLKKREEEEKEQTVRVVMPSPPLSGLPTPMMPRLPPLVARPPLPAGRPLAPAPCLPQLKPGQSVVFS